MHIAFALPDPAATGGVGGTAYIQALAPALTALGHHVDILTGATPAFPPGAIPVIDGMLLPTLLPRLNELVAADAVALVHHVTAAAGQAQDARPAVLQAERDMLPWLRRVVATSQPVADRLAKELGVAAPRLLPPGAHDLPRSPAPAAGTIRVLSVGVLTPRKGHDRLLRAMARLTDLDWHLVIAGDATRNPVHAATVAALIEELGLAARATLLPNPAAAALDREWQQAGLFALATSWEGYAAGVAEALRRGIPPIVTKGGDSGALLTPDSGLVCPPDDPATFGKCLRRLLFDTDLRTAMADAAWQQGQRLPGWPQQAQAFATILRS